MKLGYISQIDLKKNIVPLADVRQLQQLLGLNLNKVIPGAMGTSATELTSGQFPEHRNQNQFTIVDLTNWSHRESNPSSARSKNRWDQPSNKNQIKSNQMFFVVPVLSHTFRVSSLLLLQYQSVLIIPSIMDTISMNALIKIIFRRIFLIKNWTF